MKDNKINILVFKKQGCRPCENLVKDLANTTLPITEYYDIGNPDNLEICEKYDIRKVPTIVFVDPLTGDRIKQLNGKIDSSIDVYDINSTLLAAKRKLDLNNIKDESKD